MPVTQVKKVACPSCGAPLLFGPGEITARCTFCHAVVERPLRAGQPATVKSDPAVPPPSSIRAGSPRVNRSSIFPFLALSGGVVVAIAVCAALIAFADNGFSIAPRLIFVGPAAALPADRTEGPDVIALAYDISSEKNLILRVDPVAGKVLWRGEEIEDISDVRTILPGDGRFFTVEKAELHAYRSADGKALWQARLSDKLSYCEGCLSAEGNRVLALTQDYVIEAFDTETGASAWKRRLDGYTPGYTLADGGLWVIDKIDDAYALLRLSLADGSIQQTFSPKCARSDGAAAYGLDSSALFLFDPDPSIRTSDRAIYFFYGWNPSCIERWDAASASRVWQAVDEEGFSPSHNFSVLFAPEAVYFADQKNLWSADKTGGAIRLLSEGGDYEVVPLAFEQGVLILRTKRTRGTAQFGLRGFDPAAGSILWDHPMENSEPYDPPEAASRHVDDDRSIWTWRISGGLLHLFTFQADPNQLQSATLDPKTGSFSEEKTVAFDFEYDSYFGPQILYRQDQVLWVIADSKLMAIDTAAATVIYKFP
jgi:LSD1 subclass zinc finger protein